MNVEHAVVITATVAAGLIATTGILFALFGSAAFEKAERRHDAAKSLRVDDALLMFLRKTRSGHETLRTLIVEEGFGHRRAAEALKEEESRRAILEKAVDDRL